MSIASYEGPASRKEVGDQRFLETIALRGAGIRPIVSQELTPIAVQPEQAQAVGQLTLQHAEAV